MAIPIIGEKPEVFAVVLVCQGCKVAIGPVLEAPASTVDRAMRSGSLPRELGCKCRAPNVMQAAIMKAAPEPAPEPEPSPVVAP